MEVRRLVALVVGVAAAGGLAGCAGSRIEAGVFHSSKGYRVTLPGPEWVAATEGGADLELRHRTSAVGMLANATCDGRAAAPGLDALARHLVIGWQSRTPLERGEADVNGRRAAHGVSVGRLEAPHAPVQVEAYVMKDARCVYDFAYAAPPASFEAWRGVFRRLVESFATE